MSRGARPEKIFSSTPPAFLKWGKEKLRKELLQGVEEIRIVNSGDVIRLLNSTIHEIKLPSGWVTTGGNKVLHPGSSAIAEMFYISKELTGNGKFLGGVEFGTVRVLPRYPQIADLIKEILEEEDIWVVGSVLTCQGFNHPRVVKLEYTKEQGQWKYYIT